MPELVPVDPLRPGMPQHGDRIELRHDIGANESLRQGDDVLLVVDADLDAPEGTDLREQATYAFRGLAYLVEGAESVPTGSASRDVNEEGISAAVAPYVPAGTSRLSIGYTTVPRPGWVRAPIELRVRGTLAKDYPRASQLFAEMNAAMNLDADFEGSNFPAPGTSPDVGATLWSKVESSFTYQGGYVEQATFGEMASESLREGYGAVGNVIGEGLRAAGGALGAGVGGVFSGMGFWLTALLVLVVLAVVAIVVFV